jgi:repressor LexA
MNTQVLDFIIKYKRRHDGNSPTFREIQEGCRISSTSVVNYYLRGLEDANMIRRAEKGASAKIEVTGGRWIYIPPGMAQKKQEAQ